MTIKNLLFWTVFPFLIPQALHVRRTAPRFAPADGPTTGLVGEGRRVNLLAIGDSIIAGVGATDLRNALVGRTAESLADLTGCAVRWQALGVSGYDSHKVLERLVPRVPGAPLDYIIVSVGVNDVTGLTSTRKWERNLTQIVHKLRGHSPRAVIAVVGMPPLGGFPLLPQPLRAVLGMRGRVLDEITGNVMARHENTSHVPLGFDPCPEKFAADGYHPSEESYADFGRQLTNRLLALEALSRGHDSA